MCPLRSSVRAHPKLWSSISRLSMFLPNSRPIVPNQSRRICWGVHGYRKFIIEIHNPLYNIARKIGCSKYISIIPHGGIIEIHNDPLKIREKWGPECRLSPPSRNMCTPQDMLILRLQNQHNFGRWTPRILRNHFRDQWILAHWIKLSKYLLAAANYTPSVEFPSGVGIPPLILGCARTDGGSWILRTPFFVVFKGIM